MHWSDIILPATPRKLRQFAGLWLVFLGALAWWQGLFLGNIATGFVCALLAVIIGPLGLLFPGIIRPVYRAALVLTFPIGWLVSHVILAVVFLGVLTPLALFFRMVGRDELALKPRKENETYWRSKPSSEVRRYFYQY